MHSIRTIALCVFRRGSRILVGRALDDVEQQCFMRPLGGEVKFGELAVDALTREIREELGLEIHEITRLGVLENVFTYRGKPGHEIVFVFDAQFVDERVYDEPQLQLKEPIWDGGTRWLDLSEPLPHPLYPDGLLKLLQP